MILRTLLDRDIPIETCQKGKNNKRRGRDLKDFCHELGGKEKRTQL